MGSTLQQESTSAEPTRTSLGLVFCVISCASYKAVVPSLFRTQENTVRFRSTAGDLFYRGFRVFSRLPGLAATLHLAHTLILVHEFKVLASLRGPDPSFMVCAGVKFVFVKPQFDGLKMRTLLAPSVARHEKKSCPTCPSSHGTPARKPAEGRSPRT